MLLDRPAAFADTSAMSDAPAPVPEDPAPAFAAVIALRRLAETMERDAVDAAVASGWSWARIAQALGVTRQAAHQRHARRTRLSRNEDHP